MKRYTLRMDLEIDRELTDKELELGKALVGTYDRFASEDGSEPLAMKVTGFSFEPADSVSTPPKPDDVTAAALEVAIALAEEGWSYASKYFREKWRCEERARELREIASVTDDEPLPTTWAEHVMATRTGSEGSR